VIVIKHVCSVAFDVVSPHCSLSPGVAASVSESIEGFQQALELVSGGELPGLGESVVGDLCDQHVALVPPRADQPEQTQKQNKLAHIIRYLRSPYNQIS